MKTLYLFCFILSAFRAMIFAMDLIPSESQDSVDGSLQANAHALGVDISTEIIICSGLAVDEPHGMRIQEIEMLKGELIHDFFIRKEGEHVQSLLFRRIIPGTRYLFVFHGNQLQEDGVAKWLVKPISITPLSPELGIDYTEFLKKTEKPIWTWYADDGTHKYSIEMPTKRIEDLRILLNDRKPGPQLIDILSLVGRPDRVTVNRDILKGITLYYDFMEMAAPERRVLNQGVALDYPVIRIDWEIGESVRIAITKNGVRRTFIPGYNGLILHE